MDLVAEPEKVIGQVTTVLAGDTRNQRASGHDADLTTDSADCTDACDTVVVLLRMAVLQLPEGI